MDDIMLAQFGYENLLELMPLASDENVNTMPFLTQNDVYQRYDTPAVADIEMPPFPPSLTHWVDFQETPLNSYTDYFAESSFPQLQRDMPLLPYSEPEATSGVYLADSSLKATEVIESNVSNSRILADVPTYSGKRGDSIYRQRASAADRSRKLRNAERIATLEKLIPHPKQVKRTQKLDQIIDYIKYLQLQVKDLSRSRLVSESTSNPFIFLEGYGHYFVHELMMSSESLEDKMGKLLEEKPSEAIQLLQSKGLSIMPMHLAKGLQQPNIM